MTARYAAFGDTGGWARWYADPSEIYLWRAKVRGAALDDPRDAQLLLRAVARGQQLRLDVRGLVVGWGKDNVANVDVVMSADTLIPYVVPTTAEVVAERAAADEALRQRFPGLAFSEPQFLELTGPADAVDFWRSHQIIWDDKTGPLDAFARLEGIYRGAADDGPRASRWTLPEPELDGKPATPGLGTATTFVGWAAVGAAVVWLGAHVFYSWKETAA